jgi:hypothetical protein
MADVDGIEGTEEEADRTHGTAVTYKANKKIHGWQGANSFLGIPAIVQSLNYN